MYRKYKVKVEQIIDVEIYDSLEKSNDQKLIQKLVKTDTPHICIGSFEHKIESRGRVKIIDIKRTRK